MVEMIRSMLLGQYEAALAMLREAIERCPAEHWDAKIGTMTFRQVAYHTLFFTDLYLSADEAAFAWRDVHQRGGDERTSDVVNAGLSQPDSVDYCHFCRDKAVATMNRESAETWQQPAGFSWLSISRGELHVYNIRHAQHHIGQLSASLRPIFGDVSGWWVSSGWR